MERTCDESIQSVKLDIQGPPPAAGPLIGV